MKKQIIKNLATNYIGNILGMILGFIIVPFMVLKIGKEAFGIIVLAESLIALFQIFSFSVRMSISRFLTISNSKNDKDGFNQYLSTGRCVLYFSIPFVLIPGLILSYYFPNFFNVPVGYETQSQVLFFLVIMGFVFTIPNIIHWSVLYSRQRYDLINISNYGGVFLRNLVLLIAFTIVPVQYANLMLYGVIYFLTTISQNLIIYVWRNKIEPHIKTSFKDFNKISFKEIISYSGYTSVGNISSVLYENAMNIFINIFLGPMFNTIYSISLRLPNIIKRVFVESSWSLIPTFTDLVSRNDKEKVAKLFFFYSKVVNTGIFPICLSLILFSKEIIVFWVGHEFVSAAPLMAIFTVVAVMAVSASICSCISNAYGLIKIPTRVNLGLALFNISLGVLLATTFNLGLMGVAIAALVVGFMGSQVFLPVYISKISGLSLQRYLTESIGKPLLMTALIFFTYKFFVRYFFEKELFLVLVFLYLVCLISSYIFSFFKVFTVQEREYIYSLVSKLKIGKPHLA